MSLYKIQGKLEKQKGVYYEFDSDDTPLGEGGMGKVYKGRCIEEATGKSRYVAVKFMYDDLSPYAIEKARREAAIHFRHENLIEMLGFIETETTTVLGEPVRHYHVVSEILEGVSLDKLFEGKLTDQNGNFVPFAEKLFKDYSQDVYHFSVEIIKNILSGLMTMHDAGYIHRDIDPTNIMITRDGKIKLIDFGIAKKVKSLNSYDKHLTQAGQFVGKPEYAAPELVLGAINEQNQTTDIYAVGILLFQCIVGRVPFQGDRSDILQKQLHSPLPLKLVKHKGLRKIIEIATDKSRSKRFQSAAEFRVALDKLDLSSNGRIIDIDINKKSLLWITCAACLAIFIGMLVYKPTPVEEPEITYSGVLNQIKVNPASPNNINYLQQLSSSGNSDASYLLSRLYFKSKLPEDYYPDSLVFMKKALSVPTDNFRAHDLLKIAVRQDPGNYHALYELACDYWKADQRTDAVKERDGDKAEKYFNSALAYARKAGDSMYEERINAYIGRIKEWRSNVKKLQSR